MLFNYSRILLIGFRYVNLSKVLQILVISQVCEIDFVKGRSLKHALLNIEQIEQGNHGEHQTITTGQSNAELSFLND